MLFVIVIFDFPTERVLPRTRTPFNYYTVQTPVLSSMIEADSIGVSFFGLNPQFCELPRQTARDTVTAFYKLRRSSPRSRES